MGIAFRLRISGKKDKDNRCPFTLDWENQKSEHIVSQFIRADPDAYLKLLCGDGHSVEVHHLDGTVTKHEPVKEEEYEIGS